jgi:SusD family.
VPAATPYTVNDFASQDELVSAIMQQRRFELAYEGFYRYDLIRTGEPLRQPDIPENKKVLPIPQIEIDISNGILVQNTGYK